VGGGETPEGWRKGYCRVNTPGHDAAGNPIHHLDEAVEGEGESEGRVGLGSGVVGEGEGDGAEAAEQGAEEHAGARVGDGAGTFFEEGAEDEKDGGGNLSAVEGGEGAAHVDPAAERGGAIAEGGDGELGRVLAAVDVAGGGAQAAMLASGIDEAARHGTAERQL
jgi:hypothetical protein